MATILKGAPVVAAMNERNAALCEQLEAKGITPTLAVVRVGEREDDLSYERGVIARCGKVGVEVKQFLLPADAFAPLAAAYGLPKNTPEQAAHKAAVLEKALDAACAVPLEVMEKCAEGIALVEEYAAKGSVMAVSDAGCAAALCKAALQAASLNVFINTKLMADRERAAALDAKTDKLLDEFVSRADAVFASVTNKLRNK